MPHSHPQAHRAVMRAVLSGELTRPDVCSQCGEPPKGKGKIHAHHHDYSRPLDVEWLCPRCHRYAERGVNGKGTGYIVVRIPPDLRDKVDAVRGDVPRERWIRQALWEWVRSDTPVPPPPRPASATHRPPAALLRGERCPDCGKANGVHKGDCPAHPRAGR